jgi:hypothetical protein
MTEEDNRMENASLYFSICRNNMTASSGEISFVPHTGSSISISGEIAYDCIVISSGDIIENDMVIANSHRINDYALIRSSGYLRHISGDIPGMFYNSGLTDQAGFEYIHYVAPDIVNTSIDIDIMSVADNNASGIISISLIPSSTNSVYSTNNMEINKTELGDKIDWENISGDITTICHDNIYPIFANGTTHVIVPSGCISPSSMKLYNAASYMTNLYKGDDSYPIYPHAFYTAETFLSAVFYTSGIIDDIDEILVDYIPDVHISKLDGRVTYV